MRSGALRDSNGPRKSRRALGEGELARCKNDCKRVRAKAERLVHLAYWKNQDRIDLLLMDVVMPRMGGMQAYERIREIGGDMPAIFMTGYSSETVQSQFVEPSRLMEESGAFFLQKPYSVEGLGRKVPEVLDAAQAKREK